MTPTLPKLGLPHMNGKAFLTDGGLETVLVFKDGFDLPLFASFPLMETVDGRAAIERYMRRFCEIAVRDRKGFVMDTPTWRASRRWASELGFSNAKLRALHQDAVETLDALRSEYQEPEIPFVINGVIGPQDDGYNPECFLSADEAESYHSEQVDWFAEFGAEMVSAVTMTYTEEAIGIVRAAQEAAIACVISFTVETDGSLPSGQSLQSAIEQVDAETGAAPAYFMINCAHPDHFRGALNGSKAWRERIMGVRANASRMSHAELDAAEELDDGNPVELGSQYRELRALLPNLKVMGGCCGTDHRHIDAISAACR
ncbi:MAG: homocysteine S-methyltransferase family protein [Pseudomonadota bacterium]